MIRLYELELEEKCKYGQNSDDDLKVLLDTCTKYIKNVDVELISRAFYYCVDEFKDKIRQSGDLYYTHPLKVALIMMEEMSYGDNDAIVAALLHDVIEDKDNVTKEIIIEKFGEDIAEIVDGVTKIKGYKTQTLDKAATYSKLFESLIKDVRVILIKLADRLDNLRTLKYKSPPSQERISKETLNFYTPFAQRLGLIRIKRKLEDLSLYWKDRVRYDYIKKALEEKQFEFLGIIEQFESQITNALKEKDVEHSLTLEHKHIYEIDRMISHGLDIKDIDNFYSVVIRLMTNDFSDCYRAYGIIANLFGPVRSFEDYFSKPKINFYKALHSTHFSLNRKLVEVIIRTDEMDRLIEEGMVGLLNVKEAASNFNISSEDLADWTNWMQEIVNEGEDDAVEKIWGTILMNLDREYINVFTTDKQSFYLPADSSPLDLAFAISDDHGFHCISAKVNGLLKNMKYELKDNDIVEIITSPNSEPDEAWKNYVITFKAVVKLYDYFKNHISDKTSDKQNNSNSVKFRVIGDDRSGMLHDITNAIGQINILRTNLYKTTDSLFEGIFTLSLPNEDTVNELFARLFSVDGMRSVEIIESNE